MKTKSHLVAVNNTLLGTVNLLVLALPGGWRLSDRGAAPEIDGRMLHAGAAWATAGQAEYALVPGERRFLRLEIRIGPRLPPAPRGLSREAEGEITAGGHRAAWVAGRARVIAGLFGPVEPVVSLGFFCDKTRRGIRVTVWGELSAAERDELINAMAGNECHAGASERPAGDDDVMWFV